MSGPIHPSPTPPPRPRPHHSPRAAIKAEEPGLCALDDYSCLVGESVAMRGLRAQLRRVAPHFRVALITGEEGTGKEVIALAMHRLSAESDAAFFTHSPASLLALIPALLSRAEGTPLENPSPNPGPDATPDTLFLPEAGEFSYGEQMYLRQALRRLGDSKMRGRLPRMIFATARDLRSLSGAGQFDRTLYRAISVVEIVVPPLRARIEDIPLITCGMLARSSKPEATVAAFDGRALSSLQSHDWPGNIRELEQVVEMARQNAGENVIETIHLPPLGEFARAHFRARTEDHPDHRIDRLDDVIQSHVLDVLMRCSGNKVRAAERLGISRSTLYRMLDAGVADRAS